MPCRDPMDELYIGSPRQTAYDTKINKLEAMLCAVLRAVTHHRGRSFAVPEIDEKESGVKQKELEAWWEAHQEKDRARLQREQAAEQKRQVKAAALAKLTPVERKALGL